MDTTAIEEKLSGLFLKAHWIDSWLNYIVEKRFCKRASIQPREWDDPEAVTNLSIYTDEEDRPVIAFPQEWKDHCLDIGLIRQNWPMHGSNMHRKINRPQRRKYWMRHMMGCACTYILLLYHDVRARWNSLWRRVVECEVEDRTTGAEFHPITFSFRHVKKQISVPESWVIRDVPCYYFGWRLDRHCRHATLEGCATRQDMEEAGAVRRPRGMYFEHRPMRPIEDIIAMVRDLEVCCGASDRAARAGRWNGGL